MFKLVKYFVKETLVAFYKIKDVYFVQKQIVKNNNILSSEEFKFEKDEELVSFIKSCFIENTQTYVSTIIDTFNQGCVDSCSHSKYKELGINIENIKILCLKNYSIFIGLYELNNFQKEMNKFQIDFIFSPYFLIDINKKNKENSLYILFTENFVAIMMYEDKIKPKYSNIYQFKTDDNNNKTETDVIGDEDTFDTIDDDLDDIDLVDEIEELDDLDDTLDDSLDDIDSITDDEDVDGDDNNIVSIQDEISDVKNEIESLDFIKTSIKDYYENYSDNFLERVFLFYSEDISNKFVKTIESEILLDVSDEKIDILLEINKLALKDIDV